MRKYINFNNIIAVVFVLLQIINLCFVLIPGFRIFDIKVHQYIAVVLPALFSFFQIKKLNFNHLTFLLILIADLFLTLLRPQLIELGLAFFILSQFCIAIVIYQNQQEKVKIPMVILRGSLTIVGAITVGIISKWNLVLMLTIIYGVNLILNIIGSFLKQKIDWLLTIGLILFFLCDLSIGLNAGIEMGLLPENGDFLYNFIAALSFNTGWFWYIPCLTCLSLNTVRLNIKNKKSGF